MNILNGATQLPGYAVSNVGLGVTFDTINNKQNTSAMAAFNKEVVDNMAPDRAQPVSGFTPDGQYVFHRQRIPGSSDFWVIATEVTKDENGQTAQGQPFYITTPKGTQALPFSSDQQAKAHIMSERNKMSNPFNKGQVITLNQQE